MDLNVQICRNCQSNSFKSGRAEIGDSIEHLFLLSQLYHE
jgi:hypothetical protein